MSEFRLKPAGAAKSDQFGFSGARKIRSGQNQEAGRREHDALFGMFAAMLLAMTFLQKIGIVTGSGAIFPIIVPVVFAILGVGMFYAKPVPRIGRIIAFTLAITTLLASTALFAPFYSMSSFVLLTALYLPFVFAFRADQKTYLRCMGFFSTLMLFFAAIVWAQHAVQFTVGWRMWPNLDKLLPQNLLIPDFNYIQPIRWGMDYMKPSGIFFLEVSTLSQFLALAIIIELIFFQRWPRIIFLGASIFATFAGTGLLLLIVAMPLLFIRMSVRTFIGVLVTALVVLYVAVQLDWFEMTMSRVDEFGKVGSSGSARFIEPLYRLAAPLASDVGLFSGIGPGQIEIGRDIFWWPITKLSVEYGLLEALVFYAFFFYCLFDGGMSRRLIFIVAAWYSFEGTLLTAYNPLSCVMLVTMFFIPARTSSARTAAVAEPQDEAAPPKGQAAR